MSILDKQRHAHKAEVTGDFLLADDPWFEEYPGLFEILARCRYKGKARKAGRLIIYAEPDRATLVLCDADVGQVAFYAATTFLEALEGLEQALQAGSVDWRQDKRSKARL